MHDRKVRDAVRTRQFPTRLEISAGAFGTEQTPGLVEDLQARRSVTTGEDGL